MIQSVFTIVVMYDHIQQYDVPFPLKNDCFLKKTVVLAENVINAETIPSSKMHPFTMAIRKDSSAGKVISLFAGI